MAAVELVAAGAKADSGESAAVDVSAHARLVQVIDPNATDGGTQPSVSWKFETGPTANGPWREIADERMDYMQPGTSPYKWERRRVLIGAFDDFVRVKWSAKNTGGKLNFSVAGTGV